jgi:hypothetical protein
MKKIMLFFIALLIRVSLSGQSGDGLTPGTAYYGTINTTAHWTLSYNGGTIYVGQGSGNEDLTVGGGGSLIIDPGVTVIFCTQTTDLIITSLGQLSAGASGSPVLFTRYYPTNNYWGHINFTSAAGPSTLNNCIIEYCDVTRNSAPANYGGGIFAGISNLSITNCTIRNNKAEWGGGIFVNTSGHPKIANCYIQNNLSNQGGGGIYLWNYSSSLIQNCIFDSNHCNGTSAIQYTGGGLATQSNCSVKVLNCTFVNNSSGRTSGQSLMFYSSTNDYATNCIFWGAINNFYLSGTNSVTYCAVQGTAPSGTGNIVLNSSNIAVTGPNFVATDGSNWSIKYISPCRDAGTTPSPTVPTDYLGNPRIGPYDIGAYEVQYSSWTGVTNTDWATPTNWQNSIIPISGTSDVILPTGLSNYPIGSSSQNFTIGTGRVMLLKPGAEVTLGTLVNNGTLTLGSDASNISSLIATSYSGNDATIELFLTGGNPGAPTTKLNKWHFISSPIPSLPVSIFAPTYTLNVVGWYDNQVSGTLATGWIGYDGYRYSNGSMGGPTFDHLSPGHGYDYYAATDQKYTFQGQLNTGTFLMSLDFTTPPGSASLNGFNLLGNPFSSGLDWNYILNNTPFPANTSKSLYFTRDNAQCSYIGGVGIPSDVTGIIPPMQGFFVKTYSTGNTITIPAGARVQTGIHPRYKSLEIIPLVRLSLAEGTLTDETVVRFDASAKTGLDYDFDAPKMFLSSDVLSIYSTSGGSNFAIDGIPFPDTYVEIPIIVNLLTAGTNTITSTQLQGLDSYDVMLIDNSTGIETNLKTTPVLTFTAATGTISDRFVLRVGTLTTGIENPVVSKNTFNIFPANKMINIQTISDAWDGKSGSVKVMDLSGRTVSELDNSEFTKNSLVQVGSPDAKGIYFVEIKSGYLRYVGKVVIR